MADQSTDHSMEGVENPAGATDKGKGKAPQAPEAMESAAEEDSSDESAAEDQAVEPEPEDEDNMEEIDTSNIVGSRTRGKNIDFAKANKELGDEDDDEENDEDFHDDDHMEE
ncbi:histone chaperone domain CHZ-domain-containing protein [Massariosphaeria phaeospora]|uniref:Histone chaperone domain CHZ-domain-containing protein n=1 Tax=Massariosphaeria phaeospora TaxID=100035 RepID=A0A7C8IFG2_9PLEO|nr:histone chaperone domain CHZ-domain-containing protein [Massariosphaeria phaeospora]